MTDWEKVVKQYPEANFLQSPCYAKVNEILGSKVITEDFGGKGYAQMVVRNAKRGRYLEVPCGPLMDWDNKSTIKAVFTKITEIAKDEKCVFARVRPQLVKNTKNMQIFTDLGLKIAPMHLAAEHTVVIDLKKSEDELLADMRRQTRYEVRRADKQGIQVEKSRSEMIFREFHKIQAKTAERQGFVPPNLKTLLAEREGFGNNIDMYVSKTADGAPIAYGMIIRAGKEGDYYEAASTELNRKLPGAYALLWRVMRDLKSEGYERFNLWGIAPPGQPNHRYAGVTTFKTGFGGEVVEYVPAHDMIINKLGYMKDLIVETARKKRRHL